MAFELVFKESVVFSSVMYFMAEIVLRLGIFIVFPLSFFTMTAGTASLTRQKGSNSYVWLSTIFWALFTTIVLAVTSSALFRLYPTAFPVTSTTMKDAESASAIYQQLSTSTLSRINMASPISTNAFLNLLKSSDCLIPIAFLALIMGYAFRPTTEVIRPAYITLNSISEALLRLAKKVAQLLWIAIFFLSGVWIDTLWNDATVFYSWKFIVLCCFICFAVLLLVIPLIYCIATGFRRNPYRQIGRLLSAATAGLFSVNYLFSQPSLYTDCRINLGIQKRVVTTALPIHSFITKGGTALVSTMCTCSLIFAINETLPTPVQTITIALACTLASFICCLHAGYEVLFATSFALSLLKVDISGIEFSIIGILPLLNGIAIMFDVLLAGLGTSFTACQLKADCNIKEKDIV
ncbi:MAG: dicarboxylate/amino acid:cation symporter [Sphaerochaetaceae bacterium]|nr:dicarboxylate/amino acid:cation symporter [Sphaerochaetaceae bacterium]